MRIFLWRFTKGLMSTVISHNKRHMDTTEFLKTHFLGQFLKPIKHVCIREMSHLMSKHTK